MPSEESVRKEIEANMEEDRETSSNPEYMHTDLKNAWRDGFRRGWYAGTSRMVIDIKKIIGERPLYHLG